MGRKAANTETGLKNADYLVWRVLRDRKDQHDREITRQYNLRATQRPETRH